ncbi:voltage-gated purine nucleotide uniporter SLC17A9 isoform X2 [Anabrus simplex]
MPLLIPAISKERNWSKTDSGTILSSFFWGYTLTQVLGGYLSDRIGGQKVILTAAVGWSLCTFWMPYFIWFLSDQRSSVNFIVLIRVLHGAFQGVHFPSMSSLTSQRLTEKERASFFSVLTSGSAVGTIVTGVLGSYLLDHFGWPTVFLMIGLLGFMWTFVLRYYTLALDRRKAAIVSVPLKLHSSLPTREKLPVPWVKLFKRLSFWSCVIGHACQNNCFFLLLSWLPTYFHDTFPQAKGWVVNMLPWLFCIPCTFLGKWLSERCIARGYSTTATRKIIEVICLGTQALSLILINQISSYYWALLNMTLAIAATGFHNNAILVNPQDLAPKHSGSVFGLMNTVGAVPGFLGVYLAGYILETTKSWSAVFHTTAAINMIGCIIYVVFGSGNAIV